MGRPRFQPTDLSKVDHAIVERLVTQPTTLAVKDVGTPNMVAATRRLAKAGYCDGQIAGRLNTSRVQVARWRKMGGIPAALPPTGSCKRLREDLPSIPDLKHLRAKRRRAAAEGAAR
jgi:hypothetical protein